MSNIKTKERESSQRDAFSSQREAVKEAKSNIVSKIKSLSFGSLEGSQKVKVALALSVTH